MKRYNTVHSSYNAYVYQLCPFLSILEKLDIWEVSFIEINYMNIGKYC